jgi:hypothetical protein
MSAASVLLRGRQRADGLMVDTCTITRTGSSTTDPETGVVTPSTSTIYSGKCKVQQGSASGSATDIGEASVQLQTLQLHIPASATGVHVDDVAVITASSLDPDLVGRRLTVRGIAHKSFLTARRLDVQEVGS